MRLYLIAMQFLTIIPLPFSVRCGEKDLGRSMSFFPLAGLTLGAIMAGFNYILGPFLPMAVVNVLLILLLSVITGVLHLDGLADVCDGLAARGGRERFLAVMKDSHTGAAGAIGLVLVLLLKFVTLSNIPLDARSGALFCFPMLARFAQVQMTAGAHRARSDGLGSVFVGGAGWMQMLFATLTTLFFTVLFFGVNGLWMFIAAYILTWILKAWFHKKTGGITGDILGFTSELNEILCLILIVALTGSNRGVISI